MTLQFWHVHSNVVCRQYEIHFLSLPQKPYDLHKVYWASDVSFLFPPLV